MLDLAFGPLMLGEQTFWSMTGQEFWTRATAQHKYQMAKLEYENQRETILAANQTATLVQWVAAPYLKEGADAEKVFPSPLDLFKAWTGKQGDAGGDPIARLIAEMEAAETTRTSFYTPELEGDEIQDF